MLTLLLFQMKVWDHRLALSSFSFMSIAHFLASLSIDIQSFTSKLGWHCTTACNFGPSEVLIIKADLILVSL